MAQVVLDDIVSDALGAAIRLAQHKGVLLNYSPDAPSHQILGDYGRLRQLVLIILDNAIKFSPIGGQVSLMIKTEKEGTILSVKDQGKGIREEDLPFVFERFYKGDDSTDLHSTGLGLCIAKQIALRHRAAISVCNMPEGGCEFEVRFWTRFTEDVAMWNGIGVTAVLKGNKAFNAWNFLNERHKTVIVLENVSKKYEGISYNGDSGIYLWIKNIINLTSNRAPSVLAVNNVSFNVAVSLLLCKPLLRWLRWTGAKLVFAPLDTI